MDRLVIPIDSPNGAAMAAAVESRRMILFAGLPAAGKSLFVQQQAVMAAQAGKRVRFLRWDAALAAFETDDLLERYPETDSVTHPVIRKAAGLWARGAIARWQAEYPGPDDLLIGELPISGNRFAELVQIHDDAAEPLLASDQTMVFVPVPTKDIREKLVAKRQSSITNPRHADEARDAPMHTLQNVWRDTRTIAGELGLVSAGVTAGADDYDATLYSRFFHHLLQHRTCRILTVDTLYPGVGSSHELDTTGRELLAAADEAADSIATLESAMSTAEISRAVETWYRV